MCISQSCGMEIRLQGESKPQQQLNGVSFTPDSPTHPPPRYKQEGGPEGLHILQQVQNPRTQLSLTTLDSFVLGSILISWSEMPTSYRSCCKGESVTRTGPSWAIRPWLWDLSTWQRWEGHSLQPWSPRARETHQSQPVEPSKWVFQPSGWVFHCISQVNSIFGNSGYTSFYPRNFSLLQNVFLQVSKKIQTYRKVVRTV